MSSRAPRSVPRLAGLALLAAPVTLVNAAFAVVHLAIGALAGLLTAAARVFAAAGLTPARAGAEWMRRVAVDAAGERARAVTLGSSPWTALGGSVPAVPPRQWLSHTLIASPVRLGLVPVGAAISLGAALVTTEPTARWAAALGRSISRHVGRRGLVPGEVGHLAVARTRLGFCVMVLTATPAMMDNNQGIVGGLLALLLGDPDWLAGAMRRMRGYADYIHEKERQGELWPGSGMPFGPEIVRVTGAIVAGYPGETVEAILASGFVDGARAYWKDRRRVHRYLRLYLPFTWHMMVDMPTYFVRGLLDSPDAQTTTLCELAVVTSGLSHDEQDAALLEVQAHAPASIVEFEHYVGLVRPREGTVAEKAIRQSPSGRPLDTGTVTPSILDRNAVHVAQSTNAEAYALRTFVWLYRDEARGREVNHRETTRKYGPTVASRLAADPKYPLEHWEVDALVAGGPRPEAEVEALLVDALRERGLESLAGRVASASATAAPRRSPASDPPGCDPD